MDLNKLKEIVAGTDAGTPVYVGQVAGQPMLAHVPPLIEVNLEVKNPADGSEVICRALPAAKDYLAAQGGAAKSTGNYAIMTGIALPELKRRGNTSGSGAPTRAPWWERYKAPGPSWPLCPSSSGARSSRAWRRIPRPPRC